MEPGARCDCAMRQPDITHLMPFVLGWCFHLSEAEDADLGQVPKLDIEYWVLDIGCWILSVEY